MIGDHSHKLLQGDELSVLFMTGSPFFEPTKIGKKIEEFYGYRKKIELTLNENRQNAIKTVVIHIWLKDCFLALFTQYMLQNGYDFISFFSSKNKRRYQSDDMLCRTTDEQAVLE